MHLNDILKKVFKHCFQNLPSDANDDKLLWKHFFFITPCNYYNWEKIKSASKFISHK